MMISQDFLAFQNYSFVGITCKFARLDLLQISIIFSIFYSFPFIELTSRHSGRSDGSRNFDLKILCGAPWSAVCQFKL